jgi:hypothetical protein
MDKDKKLKLGLLISLVTMSGAYLALSFMEEDGSGGHHFSLSSLWKEPVSLSTAPDPQDMGGRPVQPEKSAKKGRHHDASTEEHDSDSDDVLLSVNFEELNEDLMEDRLWEDGILRSQPKGVRSGVAVLDALKEIDDWTPVKGGYSEAKLAVFLRHPKLWVRLGAFAFALKAQVLNEKQEAKIARLITLKSRENPFQLRRFLTRYEDADPSLFQRLMERLVNVNLPREEIEPFQELQQESDEFEEENFES